jgi:hypothetical protein
MFSHDLGRFDPFGNPSANGRYVRFAAVRTTPCASLSLRYHSAKRVVGWTSGEFFGKSGSIQRGHRALCARYWGDELAKLKALLRKAAERTIEGLWAAIGRTVDLSLRRHDASATAKAIHPLSEKSRALASARFAHGKVSGLVSLVGWPNLSTVSRLTSMGAARHGKSQLMVYGQGGEKKIRGRPSMPYFATSAARLIGPAPNSRSRYQLWRQACFRQVRCRIAPGGHPVARWAAGQQQGGRPSHFSNCLDARYSHAIMRFTAAAP